MKKICIKCQKTLNIENFHKGKSFKDGHNSACKKCRLVQEKKRYKKNRAITLERVRKYRDKNKELIKWRGRNRYKNDKEYKKYCIKYQKEYRKKNKEKILRYAKKYREKNRNLINKKISKYSKTEKGKFRDKKKDYKRRMWKKENGGFFSLQEWQELKKKFNYCCAKCKMKKKLTVDHIIPLSKNGTDYIWNIQPLCQSCNSSKKDKIL